MSAKLVMHDSLIRNALLTLSALLQTVFLILFTLVNHLR